MAGRGKRRLDELEGAAFDDPEDLDYGASSSRPQKRRTKTSRGGTARAKKRQRKTYNDTDDDIEDDEEEEDISEEEYSSQSAEEPELEINPLTGRTMRSSAKKPIRYEEKSEDDLEASDEDEPPSSSRARNNKSSAKRKSLIVKLKLKHSPRDTRARGSSKATRRGPTPEVMRTRRSSRISHDEQEPMYALTSSGRHTEVVRPGTRSPEPEMIRPVRGGKGLKKPPSAIMEVSQETSHPSREIHLHDPELAESPQAGRAGHEEEAQVASSVVGSPAGSDTQADPQPEEDIAMEGVVQESVHGDEDDEEDEGPVSRSGRNLRSRLQLSEPRATRSSQRRRKGPDESSDFEPNVEEEKGEENMSSSEEESSRRKGTNKDDTDTSNGGRRSQRLAGRTRSSQRSRQSPASDEHDSELDHEELAEEAEELAQLNSRRHRPRRHQPAGIVYDDQPKLRSRGQKPDYRIFRPELALPVDDDDAPPSAAPLRNRRGGGSGYRSLFSLAGPFGGAGGPPPLFGGPEGTGAAGGVESDSSDDDMPRGLPRGVGGTVGMTPTTAVTHALFPQTHNADPVQGGTSGGPANFGRVKDKKTLADADPLGVDQSVNFEGVGGLDDHINQLKEMVLLPLLYPEVFQKFHVTPPRGVLFHGPPGTGKTLLARALASDVSSEGKKVTFYMRKGADALSKWVGEAERQLRLLFEEARKNQPSIIFFDEIDGLAPVRSSKQEQIHASIVATLLALMDGMDGRGQVIVIGATNRPDSVDPALRRPGRFDREFYFPLPNQRARRAIIDIHTKGWDPPLRPNFKDQLAELTKGYGGADLRALCTEAALNAVQGTYPQIYQSKKKLIIDPNAIKVLAKDFMISVNKLIPSSERSGTSTAAPLGKGVQPLLRGALDDIARILEDVVPQNKKLTALEEAQYDDRDDTQGFERETMQREFERARIFRPRLLIRGVYGMGQQYLGPALLNRFETLHVQSFDLPTLLEDSSRSPEAAIVQLFKEVRRHKPSVIYIPNVDIWYQTVASTVIKTFTTMLRSLPPNDSVLVLGVIETDTDEDTLDPAMMRDLFGFSTRNQYHIVRPDERSRKEYFETLISYIRKPPTDFPDPENRKKRKFAQLEEAPVPKAPEGPTKEQLKAQKKQDRLTLNLLKIHIQPVMDMIKKSHKKFRTPVIDDSQITYLYDEQNPAMLGTDLTEEQRQQQQMHRPYELATDKHGVPGLKEVATGKFYYNLDIVVIEKRLSNGYYKRPKDFLADIKRIAKDAQTSGDEDRTIKANEMVSNVEVDMRMLDIHCPGLSAECEALYEREQAREREVAEKAKQAAAAGENVPVLVSNVPPPVSGTTTETSGPVQLGERIPGRPFLPPVTPDRRLARSLLSNGESLSATATDGSHPHQSNGSTVPSRFDEDTPMADSQDVPSGLREKSARPSLMTPSGPNTQQKLSQTQPLQRMAAGSQPQDYHNSASTTTSGQKTSDRSNRTSDHTQSTNGVGGIYPDFSAVHATMSGGSQIPDTQGRYPFISPLNLHNTNLSTTVNVNTSFGSYPSFGSTVSDSTSTEAQYLSSQQSNSQPSQSSQPHTQNQAGTTGAGPQSASHALAMPAPRQPTSITSLLNAPQANKLVLDESSLLILHKEMVTRSSGLSVEQLEQVNAALMDAVWKNKGNWNRNVVISKVKDAFDETIKDIQEVQRILPPSFGTGQAGVTAGPF